MFPGTGTSVKAIKSAAAAYGLSAKAFRYELDMVQDISFPAIIHWNFNHFVVLCGFTKKGAVINDPARGRVTVSMKEFDQAFTGVVIMFEKNDDFEAGGEKHSVMNFAKKRLRGTRSAIIFVFITTVFVTVVGIVQPLFSKVFMDSILTKGQSDWLMPFIGIMAIVLAFSIVINYLQAVYLRKIQGKFAVSANSEFMWHVLRLPMHFFSQRNAGDLVGRQGLNQSITNTLVGELAPAGLDLLTLVLYLTIMLKYSVILTAVGLVTVAINLFSAGYISNKIMNISRVAMRERGKVDSTTTSGIEMIETIKAAGAESGFFERWSGFIARESVENNRVLKTNIYMNSIPQFLTSLANSSVLLIGALLIINGDFTVGMLMAFQGFIAEFLSPALSLINVGTTVQQMRASMERVEDVMEYPADVDYTKDENDPCRREKTERRYPPEGCDLWLQHQRSRPDQGLQHRHQAGIKGGLCGRQRLRQIHHDQADLGAVQTVVRNHRIRRKTHGGAEPHDLHQLGCRGGSGHHHVRRLHQEQHQDVGSVHRRL